MSSSTLIIRSRFCGPDKSGNGGYVCGRVAACFPGAASVRLKAPPPLETELRIEHSDSMARLMHGATIIAEGSPAKLELKLPAAPSLPEARAAAKSCPGFLRHPFPRCFVCGPKRAAGDGMRIFPGPVASGSSVAAPWVADASLADDAGNIGKEFLWAALDCTSGFAVLPIPEDKAIVLGELSARIDGAVTAGEACVVVGWPLQVEGRKRIAGTAVFGQSGEPVAVGRATWIEVPLSAFAA